MKIEMKEISVREIFNGYLDNQDNGVVAYHGCLNVRPAFQREFIYKEEQRNEVIKTIRKGFPLNIMYWSVSGKDKDGNTTYELMDGQQRTISICQYIEEGGYSIPNDCGNPQGFGNLTTQEQNQILDYKLNIYICEGNEREKLDWFKIINIAGVELTAQELRNAIYTGPWLADAKKKFSKNACVAYKLGENYMNGELIRQAYLETAISWIADKDNLSIEEYMAKHQQDENAEELWEYYQDVIKWVKVVFPTPNGKKPRKEMKGVKWGILYNKYSSQFNQSLEDKVAKLMADEDVQKKSGIFEYLLSGEEKHLSIRAFRDSEKRTAYEKQNHKCNACGKEFPIEKMHADHITPWSRGGKTVLDNCQMLCRDCNLKKSDDVIDIID